MTLAELGMAFWHDLAVPVIAGILASMIVNWLHKRKERVMRAPGCRNGNLRPDQAAGGNSAAFFVLTAGKAPSRRRSGERTVYPGIE